MNLSLLGAILAKFQFWWFSGLFWPFFPCKNWFFFKSISTHQKKILGKNTHHPQFLYHINQWKNTGPFDFGTFCYFQPYLPCRVVGVNTYYKQSVQWTRKYRSTRPIDAKRLRWAIELILLSEYLEHNYNPIDFWWWWWPFSNSHYCIETIL